MLTIYLCASFPIIYFLVKCLVIPFAHFYLFILVVLSLSLESILWVLKSFITHLVSKYFFLIIGLFFHFLRASFEKQISFLFLFFFIFMNINLSRYYFLDYAFGILSKTSFAILKLWKVFLFYIFLRILYV